jgi:hypothetical protein
MMYFVLPERCNVFPGGWDQALYIPRGMQIMLVGLFFPRESNLPS